MSEKKNNKKENTKNIRTAWKWSTSTSMSSQNKKLQQSYPK